MRREKEEKKGNKKLEKKNSFHVDMSGRIYENKTIGIALVGIETKEHCGCALKGNLVKLIKKKIFKKNLFENSAKLYAICISMLVEKVKNNIQTLIICNDENFEKVKKILKLIGNYNFEIISISEFRKRLGRNVGSLADNYARIYRKKALKPNRWTKGKALNVVEATYTIIKQHWEKLNENE